MGFGVRKGVYAAGMCVSGMWLGVYGGDGQIELNIPRTTVHINT